MEKKRNILVLSLVLLLVMSLMPRTNAEQKGVNNLLESEVTCKIQKLQVPFIANKGQMSEDVKYYAHIFGGIVSVTRDGEIIYSLPMMNSEYKARDKGVEGCGIEWQKSGNNNLRFQNTKSELKHITLKETILGGKVKGVKGKDKAITKVSYFKGKDASKWKTKIPTYNVVTLGEVYDGVELRLRAYGNTVEKLFYVEPDASPDIIKLRLDGAKDLKVNSNTGELEVKTECGDVKFTKPVAYQEINGKRVKVDVDYSIAECGARSAEYKINLKSKIQNPQLEYGFKVASYDRTKELIIDPLLASTFIPEDYASEIAINQNGNIYISGGDPYNRMFYVSLLNSDLTRLLVSTYFESDADASSYCNAIALDSNGNLYMAGSTGAIDFPTTEGAYDTTFNKTDENRYDAFISKLSPDLTELLASTYLGGDRDEDGVRGIAIDSTGNVYVNGKTESTDFPITSGAYDNNFEISEGFTEVFISKLDNNLTDLLASTYLGGKEDENGLIIAIDFGGNVYVAGQTTSKNFPTTKGAYDSSFNDTHGLWDTYISKLNGNLTSLLASTYLGGTKNESIRFINTDSNGDVYVVGVTDSPDFPVTPGAYDTSLNCTNSKGLGLTANDVFVSKLNSNLTDVLASTFLGGTHPNSAYSAAIDPDGNVYVCGMTSSSNFPTTKGAYDVSYNGTDHSGFGDAFVSKLNGSLTNLLASTFLGGTGQDWGDGIALNLAGDVYVCGHTSSADFPLTEGAYYTTPAEIGNQGFVSKFDCNLSADTSTGRIYGKVMDINNEPIESAKLNLKGKNTKFKDIKFSDENGFFEFAYLGVDSYRITATKKGYKKEQQDVELGQGEEKAAGIIMEAK